MQSSLLPLLTFMAVAMGIVAVFSLLSDIFTGNRQRIQERLNVEFHNKQREKAKRSLLFKGTEPFQVEPMDNSQAVRVTWAEWLQTMLDQLYQKGSKRIFVVMVYGCTRAVAVRV